MTETVTVAVMTDTEAWWLRL